MGKSTCLSVKTTQINRSNGTLQYRVQVKNKIKIGMKSSLVGGEKTAQ